MPKLKCLYNFCTDTFIRSISNKFINCNIHPNIITLVNLTILTPLIFYNLLKGRSYAELVILVLIRIFLDVHDGNTSRKCDLQSNLGGLLDLVGDFSDFIFTLSILFVIIFSYYKYGINNIYYLLIFTLIFICFIESFIRQIVESIQIYFTYKTYKLRKMTQIDILVADNTIIFTLLFVIISKWYINYLQK